ncbi:hypothetical protein MBLNU459_g5998t2 [Dothideomycetes sp. NU459]
MPDTVGRQRFEQHLTLIEDFLVVMESWKMNVGDNHKMHIFLSMVVTSVKARSLELNPADAVAARVQKSIDICKSLILSARPQNGPVLPSFLDHARPEEDNSWDGTFNMDFDYYPGFDS